MSAKIFIQQFLSSPLGRTNPEHFCEEIAKSISEYSSIPDFFEINLFFIKLILTKVTSIDMSIIINIIKGFYSRNGIEALSLLSNIPSEAINRTEVPKLRQYAESLQYYSECQEYKEFIEKVNEIENASNDGDSSLTIDWERQCQNAFEENKMLRRKVEQYNNECYILGGNSLVVSSIRGDIKAVDEEISANILNLSYSIRSFTGLHPLIIAAYNDKIDVLRYFVERCKFDVDEKDGSGNTALIYASSNGSMKCFVYLINIGADTSSMNNGGWTAFMMACQNGHMPIVKTLYESGASLNTKSNRGLTPIIAASKNGHTRVITYLIENGADTDCVDSDGSSPLHFAAVSGQLEIVKLLHGRGSNIDQQTNRR